MLNHYTVTVANLDHAVIAVEQDAPINPSHQKHFPQYQIEADIPQTAIDLVVALRASSGQPVENWVEF